MLIFLDAEFTSFERSKLISIGMVADTDDEFYAEVPYSENECSDWVRKTVIPLLGKHPEAFCQLEELAARITGWLVSVKGRSEDVEVIYDFPTDWDLLVDALNNRVPPWCKPRHIGGKHINQLLRYSYLKRHGFPEHHALYDARATKYAYRER